MRTLLTVAVLLCAATAAYGEGRERRGLRIYDLMRGNKGAEPDPAMVPTPKPNKKFKGFRDPAKDKGFNIEDALNPANDKGFNIEDALNPGNNRNKAADRAFGEGNCDNIKKELAELGDKLELLSQMSGLQLKLIQDLSQRRGK